MNQKRLILVPTYNELENSERLYKAILALKIKNTDVLFIDDNSPDGTGKLLDKISKKDQKVKVIHRSKKSGIGSAHLFGISWAYKHNYSELITMDCDFTHPPFYIPKIINAAKDYDVMVASRYLQKDSLVGWNIYRKSLTLIGHLVTRVLLGIKYDATSAFRFYRLDKIPKEVFGLVTSKSYSFFPESLYVLNFNGFKIGELPIKLPPRTYGHSKMALKDIFLSVKLVFSLYVKALVNRDKLKPKVMKRKSSNSTKEIEYWEEYWQGLDERFIYDLVASFYRKFLIKPSLNHFVKKYFKRNFKVLHAGSGGGEVDEDIRNFVNITALDFSPNALNKYVKVNKSKKKVITILGDVRSLPIRSSSFDGIYNLGVMEHFNKKDIDKTLREFKRVLKPKGTLIIYWPPEFGLSVVFFKTLVLITKKLFGVKKVVFHPLEISRLRSEKEARKIFKTSGFRIVEYYFGIRDLFTYSVIVAKKI